MRDLLNDLNNLDKEQYHVSSDFNTRVMNKIHREKILSKILRVASLGAVACLAGLCVFTVNKLGVLDRIRSASSNSTAQNSFSSSSLIDNDLRQEKTYNIGNFDSVKPSPYSSEEYLYDISNESIQTEEATNGANVTYDEKSISIENEEVNSFDTVARTYSKQMDSKSYLEEINNLLKNNGYKTELNNEDNTITINSDDYTSVYQLLEDYIDILIEMKEETLIISLQ